MRAKIILNEKFITDEVRHQHFVSHVLNGGTLDKTTFKNMTEQQYEALGDWLVAQKIDNKTIFGYVSRNASGRISNVKWSKATNLFVAYIVIKNESYLKSVYTKTFREYNGDKAIQYVGEIVE